MSSLRPGDPCRYDAAAGRWRRARRNEPRHAWFRRWVKGQFVLAYGEADDVQQIGGVLLWRHGQEFAVADLLPPTAPPCPPGTDPGLHALAWEHWQGEDVGQPLADALAEAGCPGLAYEHFWPGAPGSRGTPMPCRPGEAAWAEGGADLDEPECAVVRALLGLPVRTSRGEGTGAAVLKHLEGVARARPDFIAWQEARLKGRGRAPA